MKFTLKSDYALNIIAIDNPPKYELKDTSCSTEKSSLLQVYCVRHQLYTKRGHGAYYEPQSDDEIPEYSIAMLSELFDLLQKFPYQTAEVDGVKVRY